MSGENKVILNDEELPAAVQIAGLVLAELKQMEPEMSLAQVILRVEALFTDLGLSIEQIESVAAEATGQTELRDHFYQQSTEKFFINQKYEPYALYDFCGAGCEPATITDQMCYEVIAYMELYGAKSATPQSFYQVWQAASRFHAMIDSAEAG